jgi:2-methylcitrate dehydratase PrpD
MPAKDSRLYLIHIRECCQRILDYTGAQSLALEMWETESVREKVGKPLSSHQGALVWLRQRKAFGTKLIDSRKRKPAKSLT